MKKFLLFFGFNLLFTASLYTQITWEDTHGPEGIPPLVIVPSLSYGNFFQNDTYTFIPHSAFVFRNGNGANWEKTNLGSFKPFAVSNEMVAGLFGGTNLHLDTAALKFLVSYDDATTWEQRTMPPGPLPITLLAICKDGIFASRHNAPFIYRSLDEGLSWDTLASPFSNLYSFTVNDEALYAKFSNKYWRFDPVALNWTPLPVPDNDPVVAFYVKDSVILIATTNAIKCSHDFGVSWTVSPAPNYTFEGRNFVAVNNRIYVVTNIDELSYSEDNGLSWTVIPTPFIITDLGKANGQLLCFSYYQSVSLFDPLTATFSRLNSGLPFGATPGLFSDDEKLWAGTGSGIHAYDYASAQWQYITTSPLPPTYFELVKSAGNGNMLAKPYSFNRVFATKDNWATWKQLNTNGVVASHIEQLAWLGNNLYIGSSINSAISKDFGETFQTVSNVLNPLAFNNKFYGILNQQLYHSPDSGLTWLTANAPISGIKRLFASSDRLWAFVKTNTQEGLFTSTDGMAWNYAGTGLPDLSTTPVANPQYIWNVNEKHYLFRSYYGFFVSNDTGKIWLPVMYPTPYNMVLNDTTFYASGNGVQKLGIPDYYGVLASGKAFDDSNGNAKQDASEMALPGLRIGIRDNRPWMQNWFIYTDSAGNYAIGINALSDTLFPMIASKYLDTIVPPFYVLQDDADSLDFAVHFKPDVTDMGIYLKLLGRPRPGFNNSVYIRYENLGTRATSGEIGLKVDPNFEVQSVIPPPSAIIGTDSLVWSYTQLERFTHDEILITGKIKNDAVLGLPFHLAIKISTDQPDFDTLNNRYAFVDTIVGSYDPNEKHVSPERGLTLQEIAEGHELEYTVFFQNTGTYPAERVRITDQLHPDLDFSSLRLLHASHDIAQFKLWPGGLLEVIFDPIMLPDSNSNEPESHGFVSFAVKTKPGLSANFKIPNRAFIFFDFNEPIITNTVTTQLFDPSVSVTHPASATTAPAKLTISPNPAREQCWINSNNQLSGPATLLLFDAAGRVCREMRVGDAARPILLKTAGLPPGIYTITLSGLGGIIAGKLSIL